jgi:transcription-repair coupling factor (superfamily II helicase)
MDRLICADVGFGKTEVALRAVFKAVQDNYQAPCSCPRPARESALRHIQ